MQAGPFVHFTDGTLPSGLMLLPVTAQTDDRDSFMIRLNPNCKYI
jgi:hypothetical protein